MESIIPGVHVLSLDFETEEGTQAIHPAAVETEGGILLVDTGMPDHPDVIAEQLREAGYGLADVEQIVITHQDFDHAGGLDEVRDRTGAPVFAHTVDTPYITREKDLIKGGFGAYDATMVDVEVVDGVTFNTDVGPAEAVATPGHTPGHMSLYFPDEQFLLAGDALIARDGLLGPLERATPDMDTALDSVGRLADLDIDQTLCYHGGYVDHDAGRIRELHAELTAEA